MSVIVINNNILLVFSRDSSDTVVNDDGITEQNVFITYFGRLDRKPIKKDDTLDILFVKIVKGKFKALKGPHTVQNGSGFASIIQHKWTDHMFDFTVGILVKTYWNYCR